MKDFHDLHALIKSNQLDEREIGGIIQSVFDHRKTELKLPLFLNQEIDILQNYWKVHLRGLPKYHTIPENLESIVSQINRWLVEHTELFPAELKG